MSEPSSVNFSVNIPGQGQRSRISRILTLDRLIEWIRSHEFDEHTTETLIAMASRYPYEALPLFKKNFNLMLQRARATRKKDENHEEIGIQGQVTQTNISSLEEGINQKWKESETNVEEESSETINEENSSEEIDDWKQSQFEENTMGNVDPLNDSIDGDTRSES